jgi:PAS domain S-box-containing protein
MTDEPELRRRIEAMAQEESLEDLYENAPSGYISTLPDGTFVKVNQTFLSWIGFTRDELLAGIRFQDLLTVVGKIYHETHYMPLLHMQRSVSEVAFDLRCKAGQQLPVLITSVQKTDEVGRPLLNRTTVFKALDRRKYEQELLEAQKKAVQAAQSKARLLSTLGHEIGTPLSAIMLATQALERGAIDAKQQRYLRILKSSSQNLLALANDILDYGKIEAGAYRLQEHSFEIREFIRDTLYKVEGKAEEKQLALHSEIDERIPQQIVGDPVKIGQVLINLLSNAIKFTAQGFVKLTLRLVELGPELATIAFSVQDTGIGIAPDRQAYIFEEFAQASPDITLRYGGTGLGLAISRKLLQLYGSEMSLSSTPGEGATFSFRLKLKQVPSS